MHVISHHSTGHWHFIFVKIKTKTPNLALLDLVNCDTLFLIAALFTCSSLIRDLSGQPSLRVIFLETSPWSMQPRNLLGQVTHHTSASTHLRCNLKFVCKCTSLILISSLNCNFHKMECISFTHHYGPNVFPSIVV